MAQIRISDSQMSIILYFSWIISQPPIQIQRNSISLSLNKKAKITRVKTIKKGHDRDNSTWVLERLHPNRSLFQLRYLF